MADDLSRVGIVLSAAGTGNPVLPVSHGGHLGDIVYGLAYAKYLHQYYSVDIEIYISSDRPNNIPNHPSGGVCMVSRGSFEYLAPLLKDQPWVDGVYYEPDDRIPNSVALDAWRNFEQCLNLRAGYIATWPRKITGFPIDIESSWLDVELRPTSAKVVCSFSSRYRNISIDYSILENVDDLVFIGLRHEFDAFRWRHDLSKIRYFRATTSLDAAKEIASAQLFLGNQNSSFAIAEAMKVPRALESCELIPNVIPMGGIGYEYITNLALSNILKLEGLIPDDFRARVRAPVYSLGFV